ncbi:MAG: ABC transporter ATP-binding protein [Phycisphaerae bacterium]
MTPTDDNDLILDVRDLTVRFHRDEGIVRPLNGVSFRIRSGRSVGIVGESGCGKTMTAYCLLRILPPGGRITSGHIHFRKRNGARIDLAAVDSGSKEMKAIRGAEVSMIFQEPMTAFSPVHTIYNQIAEAIRLHQEMDRQAIRRRVIELLGLVGIPEGEQRVDEYPFQFSGGMRQRAMIAMALACDPRLLIADEPTTALDVTVQAQVLKLIKGLQRELGLSLMLITHDLGVIAQTVEYVYVMYLGRIVEAGSVEAIFDDPRHPDTVDLLSSIPKMTGARKRISPIRGSVPDAYSLPSGCAFHPRCRRLVGGVCSAEVPPQTEAGPDHHVACFRYSPPAEVPDA